MLWKARFARGQEWCSDDTFDPQPARGLPDEQKGFRMINVVLFEPEIPQNTGNIARTCACTGARLHLVEPLGFRLTQKYLARAGMDYWDDVEIVRHACTRDFLAAHAADELWFYTGHASRLHTGTSRMQGRRSTLFSGVKAAASIRTSCTSTKVGACVCPWCRA